MAPPGDYDKNGVPRTGWPYKMFDPFGPPSENLPERMYPEDFDGDFYVPQPLSPVQRASKRAGEIGSGQDVEAYCAKCQQCKILTGEMFTPFFPKATADQCQVLADEINLVIAEAGLGSDLRLCHFVGQCEKETGGRILSEENLNYSAGTLVDKFSYYARRQNEAQQDGRTDDHPASWEAIANKAYANRNGNGGVETGDGWRFRGRGLLQITGRENYRNFSEFHAQFWNENVNFENDPDLVFTSPKYSVRAGIAFWKEHSLGVKADAGHSESNSDSISEVINKYDGVAGFEARYNFMNDAYKSKVFNEICFNTTLLLSNEKSRNPK